MAYTYGTLRPYQPPEWAKHLNCQPTSYVQLAMRPTPIHRWDLPGLPSGFQIYLKRDDLTGSALSGNKVRKLEFLLAEALQQGCDSVVTTGSLQSNHARITALAARQLGLEPHLLLAEEGVTESDADCSGNVLLEKLAGAKIILLDSTRDFSGVYGEVKDGVKVAKGLNDVSEDYAATLRAKGANPYVIPAGGYCAVGEFGYIEAFREMMEQGVLNNFDDIVVADSGGGTGAAIAVANYLTGSRVKVHTVAVLSQELIVEVTERLLQENGLTEHADGQPMKPGDILDIMAGHEGIGYPKSTPQELATIIELSTTTAVLTDPVFTVKGVIGMLAEMRDRPERFAGSRVLFLHTGGLFTLYDGRIDGLLKQTPATNQVTVYNSS